MELDELDGVLKHLIVQFFVFHIKFVWNTFFNRQWLLHCFLLLSLLKLLFKNMLYFLIFLNVIYVINKLKKSKVLIELKIDVLVSFLSDDPICSIFFYRIWPSCQASKWGLVIDQLNNCNLNRTISVLSK